MRSTRFGLDVKDEWTDARTGEYVSWNQILRSEREQGNNNFPCSADHEQDSHQYNNC